MGSELLFDVPTGDEAVMAVEMKEMAKCAWKAEKMDVDSRRTQLLDLPDELIVSLMSFLPLSGLLACSSVSRALYRLAKDTTLWKGLFVEVKCEQKDAPSARLWSSSVLYRNKMYIAGGHTTQGATNYIGDVKTDLFEYDVAKKKWSLLEGKIGGRTEHKCVVWGDLLWFVGGYNGQRYTNDVHTYNPATKEYSLVTSTGDAFSARSALTAVVYKDKLITFGGWNGFKKEWYNDIHCFDFATRTWTKIEYTGEAPTRRTSHAAVLSGQTMYVFAGFSGEKYLNDLYAFDLETHHWTDISNESVGPKPEPRSRFCAAVHGNTMYILGGWNAVNYFSDLYSYNFDTKVWSKIQHETWVLPSLSQCSLCVYQDFLFVFGGYCSRTNQTTNQLFVYKVDERMTTNRKRKLILEEEEGNCQYYREEGIVSQ